MSNQYTKKDYTDGEILYILTEYNKGISFTKIAKTLKRQKNNIKKILIENNVWVENKNKLKKEFSDSDIELIVKKYKDGLSIKKINNDLNIGIAPIKRILKDKLLLRNSKSDGKKISLSDELKEKIKILYTVKYKSIFDISKETGLSESFINKYLSKSDFRRCKSESVSVGLIKRYRNMTYDEYLKSVDDYYKYELEVIKITRQQPIYLLPFYEKRGKSGILGAYHLDHKFSIIEGFKQGIEPKIIGGINNLEFIPWEENLKKRTKCSITINELIN
jgi:transposase